MTGRKELALHGSLLKNFFTRALRRRVELGLAIEGAEGMLWADAAGEGFWQYQCLNQFASRIGGGTEEVHRNNLGEQALVVGRRDVGHVAALERIDLHGNSAEVNSDGRT